MASIPALLDDTYRHDARDDDLVISSEMLLFSVFAACGDLAHRLVIFPGRDASKSNIVQVRGEEEEEEGLSGRAGPPMPCRSQTRLPTMI